MTKALIFIPTLTAGGAERVASLLANCWCKHPNTSVTILLLFDDEIFYPVDSHVKVRCLGIRPCLGAIPRTLALAKAFFLFRRVVKEEAPDFVLSFMNKYNVFCLASLLNAGIPTIVSERDSPTEPGRELNWKLRKILYPHAVGVITQTIDSQRYLRKRIGHKNITVIYNPIQLPKNKHSLKREKFVLNVGRLVAKKGQADLLRAFAKTDSKDWKLVFCGDGPLRESLEAMANDLGIKKRTRFMGVTKDVSSWYARAGVFAFPSYFEGFPNALAEALVAGVPTVSYDCPTGPSELIEDGKNGYLVKVGDIDKMAQHLKELTTNQVLCERFSFNAQKTADKLDANIISKHYFEFCVNSARKK